MPLLSLKYNSFDHLSRCLLPLIVRKKGFEIEFSNSRRVCHPIGQLRLSSVIVMRLSLYFCLKLDSPELFSFFFFFWRGIKVDHVPLSYKHRKNNLCTL